MTTVAGWGDIRGTRSSGGTATACAAPGRTTASQTRARSEAPAAGQLADIAARGLSRRAPLPLAAQLTAAGLVVAGAAGGLLHEQAVSLVVQQDWVADGPARAILTWPTSIAQVVACLAGAAVLLAAIVATAGMRRVTQLGGCALLLGGGVTTAGILPVAVVVVMYLVIGVLLLALCVAIGIGCLMLLFVLLADL